MAKPEVRVRLSAEGQKEVIAAFKAIESQGAKAAKKPTKGFGDLNKVLSSTKSLAAGVGIAFGVRAIQSWISSAIEATDVAYKMAQGIGTNVENLSALNLIAIENGASLEMLRPAFNTMIRYIGEARGGVADAVATFQDLGVELDDLAEKDSVEIFELLAKNIAKIPDPLEQGRIAMLLFSESASQLIPTLDALANEGLDAVIDRAEELGVLITTETAEKIAQVKNDMDVLKLQSEGIGRSFAAGFLPEISQALEAVSGGLGDSAKAWEEFGQGLGVLLKWIVGIVGTSVDFVLKFLGLSVITIVSLGKVIWRVIRGDLKGALEELRTFDRTFYREVDDFLARVKGRFDLAGSLAPPPKPKGEDSGDGETAEQKRLALRKAQARQAALDRELALIKTGAALKTAAEQREFAQGLQGVEEYYADRRKIIQAAYDAQVAAFKEKEQLIALETDPARALAAEAKLRADMQQSEDEHKNSMAALDNEELNTVKALAKERLGVEKAILAARGKQAEIARLSIEQQIAAYDLLMRKEGKGDAERQAELGRLRSALEAVADFDEIKNEAERALSDFEARRAEIDAEVAAGHMSQFAGEQRLLELELERVDALEDIAAELLAAAEVVGDPEKIAQAQDFAAAIREIGLAVEVATDRFIAMKTSALDAAHEALEEFLTEGLKGANNLEEAFRAMANSIIDDIRRMAAEMLAADIIRFLGSVIPWGGGGGSDINPETAVPPGGHAVGGLVRGPGTGTSDSILARLSDEEYVTRSWAVRQPGVLGALESINRFGARALRRFRSGGVEVRGFAEGGLVHARAGGGDSAATSLDSTLLVGLAEGLVIDHLESAAGQKVIVKTIANHRRELRPVLR